LLFNSLHWRNDKNIPSIMFNEIKVNKLLIVEIWAGNLRWLCWQLLNMTQPDCLFDMDFLEIHWKACMGVLFFNCSDLIFIVTFLRHKSVSCTCAAIATDNRWSIHRKQVSGTKSLHVNRFRQIFQDQNSEIHNEDSHDTFRNVRTGQIKAHTVKCT
jgi:hypothetical protein